MKTEHHLKPEASPGREEPVRRREDFDRGVVSSAIDEALADIGKAKMKMPFNLANELQHAHDHLINARNWVRIYSPNVRDQGSAPCTNANNQERPTK